MAFKDKPFLPLTHLEYDNVALYYFKFEYHDKSLYSKIILNGAQ